METLGELAYVWIPFALVTSVGFGLGHAFLRNREEIRTCRYWHPLESVLHGVVHAGLVISGGVMLRNEGQNPFMSPVFALLVAYIGAEILSPLMDDYMRSSF